MTPTPMRHLAVVLTTLATAACASSSAGTSGSPGESSGPAIVQPGAPGQEARPFEGARLDDIEGADYTDADVRFMQGMIHHHAQALQMTALVPSRTSNEGFQAMARRMEISQTDEIDMMRAWLRDRGLAAPAGNPDGPHMMMPGMLSAEQMQRLRDTREVEFERYWLQGMIQHHGGAIVMVQELFASPGAGQESTINFFANEVDSDQVIEIQRMQQMLQERR